MELLIFFMIFWMNDKTLIVQNASIQNFSDVTTNCAFAFEGTIDLRLNTPNLRI
jgi:phage-related protein